MRKSLLNLAFLILSGSLFAQTSISGKVVDADTKEPLVSANVIIAETTNGVATNETGRFTISNISSGTYVIKVSYLGYQSVEKEITVGSNPVTVNFSLKSSEVSLSSVLIEANKAKERDTPVAFSELKAEDIKTNLASRDIPMMLNSTPGIYATEAGGGSGDARINIRGFNQRNFAIMINGVPVNDMENGWVYWSNWAGLGDVTNNIQIQRGLGATPYSVSSIGGLINVQTSSTEREKSGLVKFETGSYNISKQTAVFSTGLMNNGVAVTGMFSKKYTDGYADRTWDNEFTYFLTIGKKIENQTFDLTIVGSPQEHSQRVAKQTISTWATRGATYNSDWGMLNGKPLDRVVNFYHKPAINFNHNWQINDQMLLASIVYLSFGTGGGTGGLGTNPAVKADGTLDWDGLYATNLANATGSKGILRASRNDHNWYGLVSSLKYTLDPTITITGGIDGRYYVGKHFREITNLISGSNGYFLDASNKNQDPTKQLHVGDKVGYYNDGVVRQMGGFGQVEYKDDMLSAFGNLSISQTGYKRIDYFVNRDASKTAANFTGPDSIGKYYAYLNSLDPSSLGFKNILGYTAKGGVNFNIDKSNNVYLNAGYYSKAPDFNSVFSNNQTEYKNVKTEKVLSLELGYGFRTSDIAISANVYTTTWKDKAIVQTFFDPVTSVPTYYYIPGLEAVHRGFEFEGRYIFSEEIDINGMFTYASNKWNNNVSTEVRDDNNTLLGTQKVFAEGAYVGDMPMTTAALSATFKFDFDDVSRVRVTPSFNYFGRLYAQFTPESRTTEASNKRADGSTIQPWKLPDYTLFNVNSSYETDFNNLGFKRMILTFSVFNAFNVDYITDADDRTTHTEVDALVFYGKERNYNLGLSFSF